MTPAGRVLVREFAAKDTVKIAVKGGAVQFSKG